MRAAGGGAAVQPVGTRSDFDKGRKEKAAPHGGAEAQDCRGDIGRERFGGARSSSLEAFFRFATNHVADETLLRQLIIVQV